MSDDKQKEELRELFADSKELIAVLTALLEKAEAKVVEVPSIDAPNGCAEGV